MRSQCHSSGQRIGRATRGELTMTRTSAHAQAAATTAQTRVPDIALINLGFLVALKEALARDPVQACQRFRLHPSDAALIRDLGFDALEALALGVNESIMTLRYTGEDLRDLSTRPGRRSWRLARLISTLCRTRRWVGRR
jgi:hypothetical protein